MTTKSTNQHYMLIPALTFIRKRKFGEEKTGQSFHKMKVINPHIIPGM
ncbi:MAG: hypothetical protein NC402_08200 [Prevotella sp.]|nr:hypothetical protein [Prevotella sp.]